MKKQTREEFEKEMGELFHSLPQTVRIVECDCGTDYCPGWKLDLEENKEDTGC